MKGVKVLLVDDSDIVLDVGRLLLERAGFSVRTASHLGQLDHLLNDWAPDLILSDVRMPELSGPELCQCLKARVAPARVPVVLVSSLEEPELEATARRCGADGWFCKSHGLDALPARLHTLVRPREGALVTGAPERCAERRLLLRAEVDPGGSFTVAQPVEISSTHLVIQMNRWPAIGTHVHVRLSFPRLVEPVTS